MRTKSKNGSTDSFFVIGQMPCFRAIGRVLKGFELSYQKNRGAPFSGTRHRCNVSAANKAAMAMIRRISSLKNLGVFPENSSCAAMPDLLKYNLIYGFNGSGKTTLSRLFASLEAGALRPELPPVGAFEIELNNGAVIKSSRPLDTLNARSLVFNDDFVEENLGWKEGRADPELDSV